MKRKWIPAVVMVTVSFAVAVLAVLGGRVVSAQDAAQAKYSVRYEWTDSAASVRYAVGRALLRSAARVVEPGAAAGLREHGVSQLTKVVNHRRLSRHRRTLTEQLLRD